MASQVSYGSFCIVPSRLPSLLWFQILKTKISPQNRPNPRKDYLKKNAMFLLAIFCHHFRQVKSLEAELQVIHAKNVERLWLQMLAENPPKKYPKCLPKVSLSLFVWGNLTIELKCQGKSFAFIYVNGREQFLCIVGSIAGSGLELTPNIAKHILVNQRFPWALRWISQFSLVIPVKKKGSNVFCLRTIEAWMFQNDIFCTSSEN